MLKAAKFLLGFILFSVVSAYLLSFWDENILTMTAKKPETIYEFNVTNIDGEEVSLSSYKGFVCLIVNVASKWGLTNSNYLQLQELHEKYSQQGLKILAFPCNQFQGQEPKPNSEIKKFATENKKAEFDLFAKINVNGNNASPLYDFLKSHKNTTGFLFNAIKWNFTKFLIDRQGIPRVRYAPNVKPNDLTRKIEELLAEAS